MSNLKNYQNFLGAWRAEYGKRPTLQNIRAAEALAKQGSKTAFALAMTMRPGGASQSQIIKVLGLPHRNKIRKLVTEQKVKATVTDHSVHLETLH